MMRGIEPRSARMARTSAILLYNAPRRLGDSALITVADCDHPLTFP